MVLYVIWAVLQRFHQPHEISADLQNLQFHFVMDIRKPK